MHFIHFTTRSSSNLATSQHYPATQTAALSSTGLFMPSDNQWANVRDTDISRVPRIQTQSGLCLCCRGSERLFYSVSTSWVFNRGKVIISNTKNVCRTLTSRCVHCSPGCSKDYVQFYHGSLLNNVNLVGYSVNGRICSPYARQSLYILHSEVATVYFHTDGSGSGDRGLQVSFTAIG